MYGNLIEVLLVEDNPADVELTQTAMEEADFRVNLNVTHNGIDALAYLHKEEQYAGAIRPDLILLDLNMPKMSGREVLTAIKGDPSLQSIPVVILTTSDSYKDVSETYALGANCFVSKPVGFDQFVSVVETIENFWFTVVKLPPRQ